jgi:hypothetical protein
MSRLPVLHSNHRGLSRLQREVATELELADARAVVAAARIRAAGLVGRAGMAEVSAINLAELAYSQLCGSDEARARVSLVATTAVFKVRAVIEETRI